jgi:hypothetical protein
MQCSAHDWGYVLRVLIRRKPKHKRGRDFVCFRVNLTRRHTSDDIITSLSAFENVFYAVAWETINVHLQVLIWNWCRFNRNQ